MQTEIETLRFYFWSLAECARRIYLKKYLAYNIFVFIAEEVINDLSDYGF